MKKLLTVFLFLLLLFNVKAQYYHSITNSGNLFVPDTVYCEIGDYIIFNLGGFHNAVEVSQLSWQTNSVQPIIGFNFSSTTIGGNGIDTLLIDTLKTYYYVSQPQITLVPPMKGVIISGTFGCTDPLACNFDSNATIDDGSCQYESFTYDTTQACNSYTWNGINYSTSGIYTWTGTNSQGCDSTVTLDLIINYSSSSTLTVTACDSYTWDGVTYDSTGTYTNVYTGVNGCDSTVTLDLIINYSSSSTVT
ncbi:hypothetical protein OA956_05190, partial [Bacteroidota bacterium]|nr:hypothetical protein [Bacteroidota bacterium]